MADAAAGRWRLGIVSLLCLPSAKQHASSLLSPSPGTTWGSLAAGTDSAMLSCLMLHAELAMWWRRRRRTGARREACRWGGDPAWQESSGVEPGG
eukprot:764138-Hanusia_phi.AAC.6